MFRVLRTRDICRDFAHVQMSYRSSLLHLSRPSALPSRSVPPALAPARRTIFSALPTGALLSKALFLKQSQPNGGSIGRGTSSRIGEDASGSCQTVLYGLTLTRQFLPHHGLTHQKQALPREAIEYKYCMIADRTPRVSGRISLWPSICNGSSVYPKTSSYRGPIANTSR